METTLSILNFETGGPGGKPGLITSPRSLEACLRLGVDPRELLPHPVKAFGKSLDKKIKITPEEQQARYEHFELRRKEKIKAIKEKREAIVHESASNQSQKLVSTTSSGWLSDVDWLHSCHY